MQSIGKWRALCYKARHYFQTISEDGKYDDGCLRIKIVEGDLNSGVKHTYHEGKSKWTEYLHFKYKNRPEHLILLDVDGIEWDFYSTDLSSALSERNKKTMHDY